MKKLILLSAAIAATLIAYGASYVSQSFLSGQNLKSIQTGSATALTVTSGSTTAGAADWTSSVGQFITVGTNAIGITQGAWDKPVDVFADANGNAAVFSFSYLILTNSATSNTVVFTLQRSPNGTSWDSTTTWSTTSPAAVGGLLQVTNVPTWFVTGAKQLRVASIQFNTNSFTATNYISVLSLNGFSP